MRGVDQGNAVVSRFRAGNSPVSVIVVQYQWMIGWWVFIFRNRDASSPAVYASRRTLPFAMQDSFPAGGLRLCRAGVEPAGALRKVSDQVILLPRTSPGARSILDADPPASGSLSHAD